ncbi:hypothetical protein [Kitasatospora sp. NPDC008115]|uniref:hypothetical protein n=1 Tax=Kitasatospora sp. NPDC008115 TaxID=3364022 RepID=UPI0036E59A82
MDLFLADGLPPSVAAAVHREALRALRPFIREAWVDAISDEPWPPEVLPAYERLLTLSESRTAVDIDLRDDGQFAVLVALAPYTISAECRRDDVLVYSAGDTGRALSVTVTEAEAAVLRAHLAAAGLPPDALRRREGGPRRGWCG